MVNLVEIVEESYIYENRPIFGTKLQLMAGNKWIISAKLWKNLIYMKTAPFLGQNCSQFQEINGYQEQVCRIISYI